MCADKICLQYLLKCFRGLRTVSDYNSARFSINFSLQQKQVFLPKVAQKQLQYFNFSWLHLNFYCSGFWPSRKTKTRNIKSEKNQQKSLKQRLMLAIEFRSFKVLQIEFANYVVCIRFVMHTYALSHASHVVNQTCVVRSKL